MKTSSTLTERLLDLAWSQWTALGVAGAKAPATSAIGLEELLLLTGTLIEADPRLRDEACDWCKNHGRLVAAPRLKTLLAASSPSTRASFAPFAATYQSLTGNAWPGVSGASPIEVRLSGKSRLGDLAQPALVNLRIRKLFGVGARADVLTALLGHVERSWSAPELAYVGYTRRNIAQILDDLAEAGLLRARRVRSQVRFEWQKREAFEKLGGPLPRRFPRWAEWVRVVTSARELLERKSSATVLGIEAHKLLAAYEQDLAPLEIDAPALSNKPSDAGEQFGRWVLELAEAYIGDSA